MTKEQHVKLSLQIEERVQKILITESVADYEPVVQAVARKLGVNHLTVAAALAAFALEQHQPSNAVTFSKTRNIADRLDSTKNRSIPNTKLVKYRVDVGLEHGVVLERLKIMLVEESGVDIKNIANVKIYDHYTCVDLPDGMPQEIFRHLNNVEINGHKLALRRVKSKTRKRRSHSKSQQSQPFVLLAGGTETNNRS